MIETGRGDLHVLERLVARGHRDPRSRQDRLQLLGDGQAGKEMPASAAAGEDNMRSVRYRLIHLLDAIGQMKLREFERQTEASAGH